MRLADHVTSNFNSDVSTAALFFDIEKAFNATWQADFLCKFLTFKNSAGLITLINLFFEQKSRRFSCKRNVCVSKKHKFLSYLPLRTAYLQKPPTPYPKLKTRLTLFFLTVSVYIYATNYIIR
jgi:hypothetical protein